MSQLGVQSFASDLGAPPMRVLGLMQPGMQSQAQAQQAMEQQMGMDGVTDDSGMVEESDLAGMVQAARNVHG